MGGSGFARRRRTGGSSETPRATTGAGPSFTDPGVQRVELEALRAGGGAFRDPWSSGPLTLRGAIAGGVLFVAFCAAFCGVFYLVFALRSSKAHLEILHLVAGSVTAGVVVTVLVVVAVTAVRRARAERDLRRQILEARNRSAGRSD